MAWTAPTYVTAGVTINTATRWNAQVKDNLDMLAGLANTGQLVWDGTWFKVNGKFAVGPNLSADLSPIFYVSKLGQAAMDLHNTTTGGTPSSGARWRLFADNVGGGAGSCTFGFYDVQNTRVAFGLTNGGSFLIGKTSGLTSAGDLDVNGSFRFSGSQVSFFNASMSSKLTVTGSKGGNAALTNLMVALAAYGLVTDSTS